LLLTNCFNVDKEYVMNLKLTKVPKAFYIFLN